MSIRFVITVKGLAQLPEKMKRFRVGILARVDMMLRRIGVEVASISKGDYLQGPRSATKLGRVTGQLAVSIAYKVTGNRVVIGSNLPYAAIHEFGGTIRAKRGPFLVFRIGKNWISKKSVVIPSRPFLRPALDDARPAMTLIVNRLANEALREALA